MLAARFLVRRFLGAALAARFLTDRLAARFLVAGLAALAAVFFLAAVRFFDERLAPAGARLTFFLATRFAGAIVVPPVHPIPFTAHVDFPSGTLKEEALGRYVTQFNSTKGTEVTVPSQARNRYRPPIRLP
ncbi:MAG: hypothetical protein A2W31_15525 [Planctomycetes bacterium RBG_16_64_10]|nr:MAG: hypothetical protein A2W31_15525 [Planctomycetes bacterium RBG_16_64_10]